MLRPLFCAAMLTISPLPALADTVISLQLSPRNAQEADALRLGLALYAIHREFRSEAVIDQIGQGNAAGIVQLGQGNLGLIRQRGRDHTATLGQTGTGQAFAIFQNGRGTRADVVQTGPASAGILFQYGW